MMNTRSGKRSIVALCACILCLAVVIGSVFALKAYADYSPPEALVNLWRQNHAVIGAINIPGTDIRYPILQHPSIDDYYLNICFDGKEGYPGSIYTNKMEGQVFDTFNTVIYGHNMSDGSYFGGLRLFRDPDYLAEHREIEIYGVNAKHVYDIFAVVVYNDKRITDYYPDDRVADRKAFLNSLKADGEDGTILLTDVAVDPNWGHIITLSTCIHNQPDNRLLIVAAERASEG